MIKIWYLERINTNEEMRRIQHDRNYMMTFTPTETIQEIWNILSEIYEKNINENNQAARKKKYKYKNKTETKETKIRTRIKMNL